MQKIEVKGLKKLGEKLAQLATKDAVKICRSATAGASQHIKKLAKAKATVAEKDYLFREGKSAIPLLVKKGNVPKNIITKRLTKSRLTSEHIVAVRGKRKDGFANRVGIFIEFGSVKQPPRPFMRPALSSGKAQAIEIMKNRIRNGLAKVTK